MYFYAHDSVALTWRPSGRVKRSLNGQGNA